MTTDTLKRAEPFIWKNARLLERRLFAYHFKGGSSVCVVTALLAYQNSDGGCSWEFYWFLSKNQIRSLC